MTQKQAEKNDAIVIGAGFAGMYLLHRLREAGFSVFAVEAAPDVGGTWYHNRYPGLRCDVDSLEYQYAWSDELRREWRWSERYSCQTEILKYAQWVADRLDLRRDIHFNTKITSAHWQEGPQDWLLTSVGGVQFNARHVVFATGALSVPRNPDIRGLDLFKGQLLHTARWPIPGPELAGNRVGLIGTGSSGVQIAPKMAEIASHLTVFQRTPAYSVPARNRPLTEQDYAEFLGNLDTFDAKARAHRGGIALDLPTRGVQEVTQTEREATLSKRWQFGGAFPFLASFKDIQTNEQSNEIVSDFVRAKIRETVADQKTAAALIPSYHFATRRTCVDTGYFEMYNKANVTLVDVSTDPIAEFTQSGIALASGEHHDLDAVILATGYDAMTGAFLSIDVKGRGGLTNHEAWAGGPETYLGLTVAGFPNLFLMTGPGSPSVLSNVIRSIEQHVDWVTKCLIDLRKQGVATIEATPQAQENWVTHVNEVAQATLYVKTSSWYSGADIPGKPKVFAPYAGGLPQYRDKVEGVAREGYVGFSLK